MTVATPPIELQCGQCQQPVYRKPWEIRPGRAAYCSKPCQIAARRTTEKLTCACGATYTAKPSRVKNAAQTFCSVSCASKFMARVVPKPAPAPPVKFNRPPAPRTRPTAAGPAAWQWPIDSDKGGAVRCAAVNCGRMRPFGVRCVCEKRGPDGEMVG
jgi:hypothetical protein